MFRVIDSSLLHIRDNNTQRKIYYKGDSTFFCFFRFPFGFFQMFLLEMQTIDAGSHVGVGVRITRPAAARVRVDTLSSNVRGESLRVLLGRNG